MYKKKSRKRRKRKKEMKLDEGWKEGFSEDC